MNTMNPKYIEKIYAGWLAKIVGIRAGASIEGWTYDRIRHVFGELSGYPTEFIQFAADDDSNGPIFFVRALEDSRNGFDIQAQDVGDALLNYACYEKGFFWWGGYGTSTEHTAYLNLRAGIPAPQSGSVEQNGSTVAEQIGGQIFIDSWGLVTPGNPDLAAHYAELAASVSHGGNGIYGGIFVAVCISYAFVEQDITAIIEKGLSYIPADCEYARVARKVMEFHEAHPDDWRACYHYIYDNYGYSHYPGNCHIIPNAAVMILALLYGNGDFSDTLNICNMCGWDTDCNVGNIATIMGVRCGLEEIDYKEWREPINDILICSSVMGSLNIMDIPYSASYMVKLAADLAGEVLPEPWKQALETKLDNCHFEYPGSTHGFRVRLSDGTSANCHIRNTDEAAYSGKRSLSISAGYLNEQRVMAYKKTYYVPKDFDHGRYDPSFSPVAYPGQTMTGSLYLPADSMKCLARPYVHDKTTDKVIEVGDAVVLETGRWTVISAQIPAMDGAVIDEVGFIFDMTAGQGRMMNLRVLLDDFYVNGIPDYRIDFGRSWEEFWNRHRKEISQFTRMKGISYLSENRLHLSSSDFGETYTGGYDWTDYTADFLLRPECGNWHMANVRVQGAIRSYAAGFSGSGKFGLYKNENGYRKLKEIDYLWEHGKEYQISITAIGSRIQAAVDGVVLLDYEDLEHPYLQGAIGVSVQKGSHVSCSEITVKPA